MVEVEVVAGVAAKVDTVGLREGAVAKAVAAVGTAVGVYWVAWEAAAEKAVVALAVAALMAGALAAAAGQQPTPKPQRKGSCAHCQRFGHSSALHRWG